MFRSDFDRVHGWDTNSIVADPLFNNPKEGDFTLKQGSPAFALGFKNFEMNNFGVKKPALKAIARTPLIPTLRENTLIPRSKMAPPVTKWMGAKLHSLKGNEFSAYGVSNEDAGVVLRDLKDSAKAAQAGLKTGDVIQAVNGTKVKDSAQFLKALKQYKGCLLYTSPSPRDA